jgi:hypothetical protein
MMEVILSSETSVLTRATWHHLPKMVFFIASTMKTSIPTRWKVAPVPMQIAFRMRH